VPQTTVRITIEAHAKLKGLARDERKAMQAVLEEAIEEHRRRRVLERVNAGYARLASDASAWASHVAETGEWDASLADGLTPEPARPVRKRRRQIAR
jgi:predicted DNA-binding protein